MDHLYSALKLLEEGVEHLVDGHENWQVMLATVATTLATVALRDLYCNWEEWSELARKWLLRQRAIPALSRYVEAKFLDKCVVVESLERRELAQCGPLQEELPPSGIPRDQVLASAASLLTHNKYDWKEKMFDGVFSNDERAFNKLLEQTYGLFAFSNPLHADVFPGARKMEAEVVRMVISLFHGTEEHSGCITSGRPESILMVVKAMRDWGIEKKGTKRPEVVACITVHPDLDNAAAMTGVKIRKVPMDPKTCKVNLAAMRRAITNNTILLVASAPQFPHGIIDDVEAVAALGLRYNVPVHVDCCLGGFLLPFMEAAGYPVPPFDFSVPGVTSISADTHKYGRAPMGTSIVMYCNSQYLHHQYFVTPDWTGGIYASPSIPGSRAGGLVAVCWATLVYQGVDGYTEAARRTITSANSLKTRLQNIPEIQLFGDPLASIVAFKSDVVDILKVGAILVERGWHLSFIQHPPGLHICLTSQQIDDFADHFVADVKKAVEEVQVNPGAKVATENVYGSTAGTPDKAMMGEAAKIFLNCYDESEPAERNHQPSDTDKKATEETTKGI